MQNLQQNNFNLSASEALPILLTKLSDPCRTDENACKIVTALKEWNYENNAVDLAPTYYQIWWDTLYNLMWDEMQSETIAYVKPNTYFTVEAMRNFPNEKRK